MLRPGPDDDGGAAIALLEQTSIKAKAPRLVNRVVFADSIHDELKGDFVYDDSFVFIAALSNQFFVRL